MDSGGHAQPDRVNECVSVCRWMFIDVGMLMDMVFLHVVVRVCSVHEGALLTGPLLRIMGVLLLVSLPVEQDPVVGGKPPRSPILMRRSYLSPVRGRRRLVQDALHGGGDPYQALYNYTPRNEDELELRGGDIVDVMEKCDDGWFVGTSRRSKLFGTFPGNYVKQL